MATKPFIVYKASAGSGKTHTLVREYLKMAFSHGRERLAESFRSILAITFTNKAAAEMKERIMSELALMATEGADSGMLADIMSELEAEGRPVDESALRSMAADLRRIILHRYSDLSVSTIDSFMHRIVRTFAHDLGQPMNFDVVLEEDRMTEQAVAQLMSLAGTEGEEELTAVLQSFAESRMEDGQSYNIEGQMASLARQLFKEDAAAHLKELGRLSLDDFRVIQQRWVKEMRVYEAAVRRAGTEMLELLHEAGLDVDTSPYGMSGYYGWFSRLAAGTVAEPSARTVAAFECGKMTGAKCPREIVARVEALMPQLQAKYDEVKRLTVDGVVRYNTCRVLLRNLYTMALLGLLASQMRQYARDNDVVHLADFNRLINDVVEDEDNPAPFIYERLGNRYRHFLIDEFQDTSVMQWHNIVPLMENGVSQSRRSIVVGDGKQSIYRFRQGDVQQFVSLPKVEGMRHHGQTLSLPGNYKVERLEYNRRSAESIVTFNNRLFNYLAREVYTDNPLVQSIYLGRDSEGLLPEEGREELHQEVYRRERGHVEVNFVGKADAEEAGFADVKSAIFDAILQTVRMLVARRGYAYKDIAILARSNADLAAIGSHLSLAGDVPQTSTESFYLCESDAVMAVIDVMRLLYNGADSAAAMDLRYRMTALGLMTAAEFAAMNDRQSAGDTGLGLPLDMPYLASLDLYDCCEEIVRQLRLDGIDTLYVASLMDNVASFSARHRQGIGDFLNWFDEQRNLSASSSEEVDAVQLLTIHKAKGLGKPVVICPLFNGTEHAPSLWVDVPDEMKPKKEADGKPEPTLPTAFVTLGSKERTLFEPVRQQEMLMQEVDDLNVLYVAFTRPKEQLFVFCPDPSDVKSRREHDRRYPTLLYNFVNEKGYDGGDAQYCHPAGGDAEPKRQQRVERLSHADWTSRVLIASPSEKAVTALQEEKIRFGIYAHDLLAVVRDAGDVESAIERFKNTGQADGDEMARIEELARRVVTDEATRRFFDPRFAAKNECELVADGHRGRPDRVVFTPDETWVVDFKTGAQLEEHKNQVTAYCKALGDMGYPSVSGWLIYLQHDPVVVQV